MADAPDPWKHREPPRRGGPRLGLTLWLGLLAAVMLLVWWLYRRFPGAVHGDMDTVSIINLIGFLALVSSGLIFTRQIDLGRTARHLALWGMIAAVLVIAYSFKDSFGDTAARIRSEFVPGEAVQTAPRTLILTADRGGNFFVYGNVNGARIRFMIDTGSSDIVLSPADAARAGIDVNALTFDRFYETANGAGTGASVTLGSLAIGPLVERDVRASVNKAPMSSSLLGMTFLKSLKSFAVSKDRLVLHW